MVQLRNSLEALVLQAWRDRWSEADWTVHLKEALRQDSSDLNKLSGLLVRQATISEVPNKLILNYLSWALTDQMVPHVSLLEAIISYKDYHRELCIEALVELVTQVKDDLSWLHQRKKQSESWNSTKIIWRMFRCDSNDGFVCERLCGLCTDTMRWLLNCLQQALNSKNQELTSQLVTCATSMVFTNLSNLCIETTNMASKVVDAAWLLDNIKSLFASFVHKVHSLSQSLQTNPIGVIENELNPGGSHSTVLTFVSVYGSCRLSSAQSSVANSLACLRCALGLPWWLVIKDLIRGAMLLLLDNITSARESSVTAFVYLKVPRVIACLVESGQVTESDIQRAVDQIACLHTLLNSLDLKTKCNSFQNFLDQMKAFNLITDESTPGLMTVSQLVFRNHDRVQFPEASPGTQGVITLIVKASGTVQTLEKSFNYSEFAKRIDKLVQMMSHMITGKSFDYICASSAAMGKLDSFTKKFIQFNETAQLVNAAPVNDESEHAVRAVMFDLSFLLLSRITSVYTDLQLTTESTSFFVHWHERFGAHVTKKDAQNGTSDESGSKGNEIKKDILDVFDTDRSGDEKWATIYSGEIGQMLEKLKQGNRMYDLTTCNWAEIFKTIPALGKLLLEEVANNLIKADQLKNVLIGLQLDVCALLLCLVEWLYHVPATESRRHLANAINLHFQSGPQPPATIERRQQHSHGERWNFAISTVRPLLESMVVSTQSPLVSPSYTWLIQCGRRTLPRLNALQMPSDEHLRQAFVYTVRQSWATPAILTQFERCIRAGDTNRWCTVWVNEMLHTQATEQMSLAAELCLAIALLCDNPSHALLLLAQQVSDFVLAPSHELYCVAPRGSVLAKFLVQAIMLALQLYEPCSPIVDDRVSPSDVTSEPLPKQRRLDSDKTHTDSVKTELTSDSSSSALKDSKTDETLNPENVLVSFYNRLCTVCEDGQLRPAVYLLASFLRILAENNTQASKQMIALLPPQILPRLIRTDPKVIPAPVVLALYELQDHKQRRRALQHLCLLRQLKAI